jgi:hypothetical protein
METLNGARDGSGAGGLAVRQPSDDVIDLAAVRRRVGLGAVHERACESRDVICSCSIHHGLHHELHDGLDDRAIGQDDKACRRDQPA